MFYELHFSNFHLETRCYSHGHNIIIERLYLVTGPRPLFLHQEGASRNSIKESDSCQIGGLVLSYQSRPDQ